MSKVNYFIQLNSVFELFNEDARIKQGHITLYLAFFQKWNREFFAKYITVNRRLIMERAKIKSKTTYHNSLKDLNNWGYLIYFPSFHPNKSSKIEMTIFGTSSGASSGQKLDSILSKPSQKLIPSLNYKINENINKLARPKNEQAVLMYFEDINWPKIEGTKFFIYGESKKWHLNAFSKARNWKNAAQIFAKNDFMLRPRQTSPISGHLSNRTAIHFQARNIFPLDT